MNLGDTLAPALMHEAERILIQTKLVQHGGVDIAEVVRLVDCTEADIVRCAYYLSALDSAAGHPHGEADAEVIAPFSALGLGGASEFPAPQNQRGVQKTTAFQILQQCGDWLIHLRRHADVVFLNVVVRIPLRGRAST